MNMSRLEKSELWAPCLCRAFYFVLPFFSSRNVSTCSLKSAFIRDKVTKHTRTQIIKTRWKKTLKFAFCSVFLVFLCLQCCIRNSFQKDDQSSVWCFRGSGCVLTTWRLWLHTSWLWNVNLPLLDSTLSSDECKCPLCRTRLLKPERRRLARVWDRKRQV